MFCNVCHESCQPSTTFLSIEEEEEEEEEEDVFAN